MSVILWALLLAMVALAVRRFVARRRAAGGLTGLDPWMDAARLYTSRGVRSGHVGAAPRARRGIGRVLRGSGGGF